MSDDTHDASLEVELTDENPNVEPTSHSSSTWKVLGEIEASTGTGVLGHNTATSGTAVGIEGVTESPEGYGLYTADDAKVEGAAELAALAGAVTGDTTVTSLLGDGLTVAGGALALGPTSVQTDTASTFGEGDVSVTHSKTTVTDNAIELGTYTDSVSRPLDTGSVEVYAKYGLEFVPQVDLSSITATISNTSGESTVYIYDENGTQLTSEPSPGAGNSVTLTTSLAAGTKYYVLVDSGGVSYMLGYYDNPSFPYTSAAVHITGGASDDSGSISSHPYANAILGLKVNEPEKSGSATVAFSRPSSVRRWETTLFDTDQDGETVDVYVERSSDGGST